MYTPEEAQASITRWCQNSTGTIADRFITTGKGRCERRKGSTARRQRETAGLSPRAGSCAVDMADSFLVAGIVAGSFVTPRLRRISAHGWQLSRRDQAQASETRRTHSSTGITAGGVIVLETRGNRRHAGIRAVGRYCWQVHHLENVQAPQALGYHGPTGITPGRFVAAQGRRNHRHAGIMA